MNLLYVLFVLDILNLAVTLPVFGAFVTSLGGSSLTIGLINSSSALISLLWNPVVGSLSDQIGRKGLLIKCLIANAIGALILVFSFASQSLVLVLLARLIGSFGSGVSILLRSIVADSYKTAEEKKAFFSKCGPFISVGFLAGAASSGFLSEAKNGFALSFCLMIVIMISAALIASKIIKDDHQKLEEKEKSTLATHQLIIQQLKQAVLNLKSINWIRYKNLFIIKQGFDCSMAILLSNMGIILLNEFNVKGRNLGLIFMITGLCRTAATLLILKLKNLKFIVNSTEFERIFVCGLLLFSSFIAMSISSGIIMFIVFLAVICLTRTYMDSILTDLIATETSANDRGKVIGAFDNLFAFNFFIAPLYSGIISQFVSIRFIIASSALPILLTIIVSRKELKKQD